MKSKWIAVLLVTSLMLNLLLIGFIVGKRGLPEAGGDPTRSKSTSGPVWLVCGRMSEKMTIICKSRAF